MIEKAPDAYRTISEVAEDLDLPQHVLRFWETRFTQIKPLKRGGGRRYYRPDDVELLKGIRHLLYSEGYTIKGVQRILKEQGPKAVQAFAHGVVQAADEEPLYEADYPAPQPMPHAPPPQPSYVPPPPPSAPVQTWQAPRPVSVPMYIEPPRQEFQPPAPVQHYAPPPPVAPPPVAPAPVAAAYPQAESEPTMPPPTATPPRRADPSVSYMRGGLLKPVIPAEPEQPAAGTVHQGYSVRRPKLPIPQPAPEPIVQFSPVDEPAVEEDFGHEPAMRSGLSDESRRALQSAMFELTECRRVIERITVARDR